MRGVGENTDGPTVRGFGEANHHIQDEQKEVWVGAAGDGRGISEEDESRINEEIEDAHCGRKGLVHPRAVQQRLQQQPQGPVVRWERFLPVRSLKVLLVENDDSTRHVVSALLRNCSYEVMAVANGLEAWKIVEDVSNHIDLVLTEVVMPCLSGIGLLCKIMNHKTCTNIPVIMMSSNDSMGVVFNCLSKGAVDFLVKPIRKNELKNLWQHVWRKCHSSSGSGSGGSESGIRTEKSAKSKSVEGSDNNTGSNDEDDNTSIGLNVRDGSDNGSGTQSSWTKRAVEVDSPLPMLTQDQLSDPPDSTCAQVIHSRPEAFSSNWVPTATTKEYHGQDENHGNFARGKDLETRGPKNTDLQLEDQCERVLTAAAATGKEKFSAVEHKDDSEKLVKEKLELNDGTPNEELRKEAADLISTGAKCIKPQMENVVTGAPDDISKAYIKDKTTYDTKEMPYLELSLKRLVDVGEIGTSTQERNVLRHSDLSAFSRYNMTSTANQAPTGNVSSCSPLDNSSEAAKTELMLNLQSNSNGNTNQPSNGSSNNNDMGSTTDNVFTRPGGLSDKPMPKSAVNVHPCSAFQPVQSSHASSLQTVMPGKDSAAPANTLLLQEARGRQAQVQVQHHHHHYHHHHHHHLHNMQQQLSSHDDLSLRTLVAGPNGRPSNLPSMPIEGNAANYSLNGSASGSNNGSSMAIVTEEANVASDDGAAGKCGPPAGGGSGSDGGRSAKGSSSGVELNRFTQREAALNKFRQKRKERCFEKRVRYQSRKRLAEQRPRVRGQFVRQSANGNKSNDRDC